MADKKITDLTEATSVDSTDLSIVETASGTRKITIASLISSFIAIGITLAAGTTIGGKQVCLADGTNCKTPVVHQLTQVIDAGDHATATPAFDSGLSTTDVTFEDASGTSLSLSGNFSSGSSTVGNLNFNHSSGVSLNANAVCVSGDCRTTWPTSGGGSQTLAGVTQLGASATATLALYGGATIGGDFVSTGTAQMASSTIGELNFSNATGSRLQMVNATATASLFTGSLGATNFYTTNAVFGNASGTTLALMASFSAGSSTATTLNFTSATGSNIHISGNFTLPDLVSGDMLYFDGVKIIRVPGNVSSTLKYLTQFEGTLPHWQSIPSPGTYAYYYHQTSSSPITYNDMGTFNTSTMGNYTFSSIAASTTLRSFITASGTPGLTNIPSGAWKFHIDATKSGGVKSIRLYADVYKFDGGTETYLFSFQESEPITTTDTNNPQEIDLEHTESSVALLATDRIIIRVYALPYGVGSNPSGAIYIDGVTQSRLELPSNTIDVTNFVPYSGALYNLNLGTKDIIYNNATGTNTTSTNLYADRLFWTNATGTGLFSTLGSFSSVTTTSLVAGQMTLSGHTLSYTPESSGSFAVQLDSISGNPSNKYTFSSTSFVPTGAWASENPKLGSASERWSDIYASGGVYASGTNSLFSGLNFGYATGTSATTTKLYTTNATVGDILYVADSIGIGTADPAGELHIANGLIRMDRNSDSAGFLIHRTGLKTFFIGVNASGVNDGDFFIGDMGSGVTGSPTYRLAIGDTGNIGIPSISDYAKLNVNGMVSSTVLTLSGNLYASGTVYGVNGSFTNATGTNFWFTNATGTNITATTGIFTNLCLTGDDCVTSWPSSAAGETPQLTQVLNAGNHATTTIHADMGIVASTGTFTNATGTTLSLTGNFSAGSSTVTSLNFTNATGSSLYASSLSASSWLSAASSTLTTLNFTGATGSSLALSGNLFAGSSTVSTLNFTDATGSSIYAPTIRSATLCLTGDSCITSWPTGSGSVGVTWIGMQYPPANNTYSLGSATGSLANIYASGTISTVNLTSSGLISSNSLTWTSATGTNVTSTNLYASNLGFNGATGSNLYVSSGIVSPSSTFGTVDFTNATGSSLALSGNFSAGSSTFTSLNLTNATGSSLYSSSLTASSWLSAGSSTLTTLNFTSATGTNLFTSSLGFSTLVGTSVTSTNVYTSNLVVTNAAALQNVTFANATGTTLSLTGNFSAGSSTVTTLGFTNATGTGLYATALGATNLSFMDATGTAIYASSYTGSTITVTSATMTNLGVTSLLVGGKLPCLADGTNCPSSYAALTVTTLTVTNVTTPSGTASSTFFLSGASALIGNVNPVPTSTTMYSGGIPLQAYAFNASTTNCIYTVKGQLRGAWDAGTIRPWLTWTSATGSGATVWRVRAQSMGDDTYEFAPFAGTPSYTTSTLGQGYYAQTEAMDLLTVENATAGVPIRFEICRMGGEDGDTLGQDAYAELVMAEYSISNYSD